MKTTAPIFLIGLCLACAFCQEPAKLPTLTTADIQEPPAIINPTPAEGWKASAGIFSEKLHTFAIEMPKHWMLKINGEGYNKADTNDPREMKMEFVGADGSKWLPKWERVKP